MPTLNQRRRETTRLEIAEAALRLFARDGYPSVTADAIAAEAGVSPRTFYRYFSAKDDVLKPIIEIRAQRVADALARRPAEESLAVAVQRAMASLNDPLRARNPQTPFVRVLRDTPDLFTRWRSDLALFEDPLTPVVRQRLGEETCSEQQARHTAAAIVTALRIAWQTAFATDTLDTYPERVGEVLSYFAAGARLGSD